MKKFLKTLKNSFILKNTQKSKNSLTKQNYLLENKNLNIVEIKGIPKEWSKGHIQKYFDPYQKKISSIKIQKTQIGEKNLKTIIIFKNGEIAESFVNQYDNDFINSEKVKEKIRVQIFKNRQKKEKLEILNENRQIELYNLPFEATNLDILKLVPNCKIEKLQIPKRSKMKNKGYCLVTFEREIDADFFLREIEGFSLFGRELKGRKKYIRFVSQKMRDCSKSDFIFQKAEMEEIRIQGAIRMVCDKYGIFD